ncbi:SigE family RNA polymerase sigma factor [Planosporangium mesophilum]|uniref:RNA polymerase sigma24 factor n=1 Tax=Planosporangium mesophilum TaxID=689768 RepID=A0A8J3TGV8_9ACTN|nr:SigE family RNA polymerase sigma factor [Planosporangium mesophilum]NJC81950.1 SigE family RNA polymerase sigma factor [Planosporangium mesophilum]GII25286.1 RNA polymerase sigma24 factor [Planosporangium mesophilum]
MALRRGSPGGELDRDGEFTEYYAARGASLRAAAYLLCGDWHLAEDLVQTALAKLYLNWKRITRHDSLDAYARRVVFRAFLDHKRRPWHREQVTDVSTGTFDVAVSGASVSNSAVSDGAVENRLMLRRALERVPPRQRAVLVLRFWEDLSVDETASILGCSPGTVKSQCARGLETLRGQLDGARMDGVVIGRATRGDQR